MVSKAGTTVSDHNMHTIIPTDVKTPKARTGPNGERAKEQNPTAVVTEVLTTGADISLMVVRNTARRSSVGRSRSSWVYLLKM